MPSEVSIKVRIKDSAKVFKMIRETKHAVDVLIRYGLLSRQTGKSILSRLEDKIEEKIVVNH